MTQLPIDLLLSERPATRPTVSLSEGSDPRVVAGALAAHHAGIADVILVGSRDAVAAELASQGASEGDGVSTALRAASSSTPLCLRRSKKALANSWVRSDVAGS